MDEHEGNRPTTVTLQVDPAKVPGGQKPGDGFPDARRPTGLLFGTGPREVPAITTPEEREPYAARTNQPASDCGSPGCVSEAAPEGSTGHYPQSTGDRSLGAPQVVGSALVGGS